MYAPPLPIHRIHHVELVVGNAKQAAFYYRHALGFDQHAYAGPETGRRDRASYYLTQGNARLILTTPLVPEHPFSEHLKVHGDGVWDIAFAVKDVDKCYQMAVERGANSVESPKILEDANGRYRYAAIHTYGDTIHSFVENLDYSGCFMPDFEPHHIPGLGTGLYFFDHLVGNVEDRKMNYWVDFYKKIFGFKRFVSFDDKDITTEFSSLRSVVVANENEMIKMPINEPADGKGKSQIQEYIECYVGPGVQHVAMTTDDVIDTVSRMKAQGMEFLSVPDVYYEDLWDRIGRIDEDIDELRKLGILVDRDENGYLLQLFTKPVEDRPTLFYEVIQRKGCQGFGKGNFKALFEAIEREQKLRGNLYD
ncbi:4-hydroxyphenylpyruvate dioxygenase [bacterium]|nr:4-hydroxyphenylpyruvate dioxygenase [bacterium]